ncbi:hypothetical protein [Carnobacterium mobile]|uniref:hypothetical protein n=1 Tax=Carnobacterium mobile TaxID=2750 RepID=UPI0014705C6C|nr:hypothetical protein [Carnobacterium mobile]
MKEKQEKPALARTARHHADPYFVEEKSNKIFYSDGKLQALGYCLSEAFFSSFFQ